MINTKEESSSEEEEDEEDEVYVSYLVKLFINLRNSNRCISSEHNLNHLSSTFIKFSNFISERAGKRRLDPM